MIYAGDYEHPSPTSLIHFGGDGLPDIFWLELHADDPADDRELQRSKALSWMAKMFTDHVPLIPDPDVDPDEVEDDLICPPVVTEAGKYRIFEFAVALEGIRANRAAIAHQVSTARSGDPEASMRLAWNPPYGEVLREEIGACMENFLCTVGYCEDFAPDTPFLDRWAGTVPDEVPSDLRRFTAGYLEELRRADLSASHAAKLQELMRALTAAMPTSLSPGDVETAAGRVHARRVVLFDDGIAESRQYNAAHGQG